MRTSILALFLAGIFDVALGADLDVDRKIPNEYETVGGHVLGLGNMATASATGLAAIRVNPSLLALTKEYAVGGGYNWPIEGRDFYQAGIVDSKSSTTAAGFSYTSFNGDYAPTLEDFEKDSPVNKRAALGLAQSIGSVTAGIGGQFLEAQDLSNIYEKKNIKGTALNIGVTGLITPSVRLGASVENLANKKIADYAPRTIRGGAAVLFAGGDVTVNVDFRQRDRVAQLEQGYQASFSESYGVEEREQLEREDKSYKNPERMMGASVSARVYDMLSVLAAYGQNVGGPDRKSLSGGLAVVSGNVSLSYSASRPYLTEPEAQQAINAAFSVNL